MLDIDRIKTESIGRWAGVMAALGIPVGDGRHCPCPFCKGKDRFRWIDQEGKGTWYCNQCNPHAGDGFGLVQKMLGVDFIGACDAVGSVLDIAKKNPLTQEKEVTPERLRELFKTSQRVKKNDPVHKYLKGRGLTEYPSTLRYTSKCYETETKQNQEAMLAVFRDPQGEALTIHRTYIKDGKKLNIKSPKKLMTPLKKMTGGAVRLYEGKSEVLGVCEGIETGIAVHEMYGVVMWPCLNANMLEAWEPPKNWGLVAVKIYADNDWHYIGQSAAYNLAKRLSLEPYNLKVTVHLPKMKDFLEDLINGIK